MTTMAKEGRTKKIIVTLVMFFGYIAVGISFALPGPALLDLQELTGSNTDDISVIFIGSAIGGAIGSILGGFLMGHINTMILLSVSIGVTGCFQLAVPYCTTVTILVIVMSLSNVAGLLFDSTGNMHVVAIWGEEHEPWMQALHCVFGAGALIGPLIAEPFLSNYVQEPQNSGLDYGSNSSASRDGTSEEGGTQIRYAYFIGGAMPLTSAILLMLLYATGDRKCCIQKTAEMKKQENNLVQHNKAFMISFITLLFIFYWSDCVLELTYANYLSSYVVQELDWTKSAGATLTSAFWASFTIGRGLGIFIVKWISCENLLITNIILTCISLFPEVFFSANSIIWVCTVAFGLFISTIYASALTFADMYIPISGGLGSIFIAASSLGQLTAPIIIGSLFDDFGMQIFVYIMFVASILLMLVFIIAYIIATRKGKRDRKPVQQMDDETKPLLA